MEESHFVLPNTTPLDIAGKVGWQAPSNIALVKYWGKKKNQIPANPSLSFTLSSSLTTTQMEFTPIEQKATEYSYDFLFEGKENKNFRPKIDSFLHRINPYLPFLKDYHFKIESSNSFPHSSGIASSASAFAALASCFMEMEKKMNPAMDEAYFYQKASFLARLGSGSACRSLRGPMMMWGKHEDYRGSSDLFAVEYPYDIDPVFRDFQDAILLVHKGEKSVSSTTGHGLMEGHRYAGSRFEQANSNLSVIRNVLKEGDLDKFVEIVESEALSLHAMMMTSIPYFLLMKPNTLEIIERIWRYRRNTGKHLCFTLDAGANVHLLFPGEEADNIYSFIKDELLQFCEGRSVLRDRVGPGARSLS